MTLNERKMKVERLGQRLAGNGPRVRFDIDENDKGLTGVTAISLVPNPAIESDFVILTNKDTPKSKTPSGELISIPITNYVVL